jgi:hypothetical protein
MYQMAVPYHINHDDRNKVSPRNIWFWPHYKMANSPRTIYAIHAPWELGVLHISYHYNYHYQISAYLRFSPPSDIACSSASGNPFTKVFRCACSRACHKSTSEWWANGSKLARNVPEKRTGSWGIIVNRDLLWQNYLIKIVVMPFCKLDLSQHFNPLPVQFKSLLPGQEGCVFFSGHLNTRTCHYVLLC